MDNKTKFAVDFFKSSKSYHRILVAMEKNYRSRGSIGGTISLANLTEGERLIICKIDSKFIDAKDARFSVKKLIRTFSNTPLEGVNFHQVLVGYFGKEIVTNQSLREQHASLKDAYYKEIIKSFEGTPGSLWLKSAVDTKEYGYVIINREYNENPTKLKEYLENVIKGVNELKIDERKYIRLAIFASKITKDPHYFDSKAIGGKLLINAMAYMLGGKAPESSEIQSELMFRFGVIKDEISNYTTCFNLEGFDSQGKHFGIGGFSERGEPIQLSLYNLSQIEHFTCANDVLYVFENPTVFSEVLQRTLDVKPSLLCTSGQLKLASLVLLDKLIDKVERVYYSGDFDPEGINIAYRLKERYKDKLILWRYDIQTYKSITSEVEFNERRLKQLDKISSPDLKDLVEYIKDTKKCAYQELLVREYIEDIKITQ